MEKAETLPNTCTKYNGFERVCVVLKPVGPPLEALILLEYLFSYIYSFEIWMNNNSNTWIGREWYHNSPTSIEFHFNLLLCLSEIREYLFISEMMIERWPICLYSIIGFLSYIQRRIPWKMQIYSKQIWLDRVGNGWNNSKCVYPNRNQIKPNEIKWDGMVFPVRLNSVEKRSHKCF